MHRVHGKHQLGKVWLVWIMISLKTYLELYRKGRSEDSFSVENEADRKGQPERGRASDVLQMKGIAAVVKRILSGASVWLMARTPLA